MWTFINNKGSEGGLTCPQYPMKAGHFAPVSGERKAPRGDDRIDRSVAGLGAGNVPDEEFAGVTRARHHGGLRRVKFDDGQAGGGQQTRVRSRRVKISSTQIPAKANFLNVHSVKRLTAAKRRGFNEATHTKC